MTTYTKPMRLKTMYTAKFISDTGSWLSTVLVLLYTNEVAIAKAQAISSVFIVRLLMPLILTPRIAKFVDRSPSGRWLVICDLMAAAVTLSIPFFHLNWATALIAGTLSTITATHFSVFNRLLKIYTPKDGIKQSILKQSLLEGLSLLLGTSLAGIIGAYFTFKVGFSIDATTFLISASLILWNFSKYKVQILSVNQSTEAKIETNGFLSLVNMPWLLLISTLAAVLLGVRDSTLIQLIVNEFSLNKSIYAGTIALSGIGGILGNFSANKVSLKKTYLGIVLVFTFSTFIFVGIATAHSLIWLYTLVFSLGFIEACYYYFRSHIFFTITPDRYTARGAGLFKIFNASARSSGILIFGYFLPTLRPSQQFLILSILSIFAALISYLIRPNNDVQP